MKKLKDLHKTAKKSGFYKKALIVMASLALLGTSVLPFIM